MDAIGGAIHHIGNVHKYARNEDVPEYIIKAGNTVCVLGDFSSYALVILSNNKYHVFSLLVYAIEQDFFIFAHITLLFYNVQDRIRYDKTEVINAIYTDYNVILWIR